MPNPIGQAVDRGFDQKRPQLLRALENPAPLPEPFPQVGPNGLHHVDRVEFRAQSGRHPPPDDHPQKRLVSEKNLFNGGQVATVQSIYNGAVNCARIHSRAISRSR
jgi:hypothetical protein